MSTHNASQIHVQIICNHTSTKWISKYEANEERRMWEIHHVNDSFPVIRLQLLIGNDGWPADWIPSQCPNTRKLTVYRSLIEASHETFWPIKQTDNLDISKPTRNPQMTSKFMSTEDEFRHLRYLVHPSATDSGEHSTVHFLGDTWLLWTQGSAVAPRWTTEDRSTRYTEPGIRLRPCILRMLSLRESSEYDFFNSGISGDIMSYKTSWILRRSFRPPMAFKDAGKINSITVSEQLGGKENSEMWRRILRFC